MTLIKPINVKPEKLLLMCVLLLRLVNVKAQSLERSIDSLLNIQYKANGTGAVALVSREGKIIYNKAFGMANLELDVPMKKEMVFEIASMTKQFTAVAILMLMEEGKLKLNDDIKTYIDYTAKDKISIHNLLNQTSGLGDLQMMDYISFSCAKRGFKPEEYMDRFKMEPVLFKPGEKWEYNNPGYFLLGYIIEKVSGMKYEEFIQKRIFDPLQMTQSYCQVGNIRELIKNRAYGYDTDQNIYNAEFLYMFQAYSAGCILSTTEDLNKWNTALNNFKLLKKESTEKLYENYKLNNGESTNYGYGFLMNTINGSPTYEHGGGAPGFSSNGVYLPNEKVYVTVLSNCKGNDPEAASLYIAALAINKPLKRTQIEMSSGKMKEYTGNYFNAKDSLTFEVTFDNNKLYFQKKNNKRVPASRKYIILPNAPDQFFAVDKFYEYEFQRNKKSEITGLIFKTRRRMQIDKSIRINNK
jgi:CubicO group peptidase (beta-lactamase class C family)